jgi:hypothetical protein
MTTTRIPRTKRTASNNLSPSSCLNVLRLIFRVLLRLQGYSLGKMGQGPKTYAPTNIKSTRLLVRGSDVEPTQHGCRNRIWRSRWARSVEKWPRDWRSEDFQKCPEPSTLAQGRYSVSRYWIVESL